MNKIECKKFPIGNVTQVKRKVETFIDTHGENISPNTKEVLKLTVNVLKEEIKEYINKFDYSERGHH